MEIQFHFPLEKKDSFSGFKGKEEKQKFKNAKLLLGDEEWMTDCWNAHGKFK